MYLMMTEIVEEVLQECPDVEVAVVADDFQAQTVGDPDKAAKNVVRTDTVTTRAFGKLDLPIAMKKSIGLVSDIRVSKAIRKRAPMLAKRLVDHGRNLGVDFSLKRRRSVVTMQSRLGKVRMKVSKLASMKKRGGRTTRFVNPCVNSAAAWGVGVLGATDDQVRERRALGHRLIAKEPRGRSATVDFALAGGKTQSLDTAYTLLTAPLYMLARAIWDRWIPLHMIFQQWDNAFEMAQLGDDCRYVAQPVEAAARTARRLGWSSPKRGVLVNAEGRQFDLLKTCPRTIKYAAMRDTD